MNLYNAMQAFRDARSNELFGRPENQLHIGEISLFNEYLKDYLNPQWKPIIIDGEDTGYRISNVGAVFNPVGMYTNKTGATNGNVYDDLSLKYHGKRFHDLVHRAVAKAFIPNPENKLEVNHKNGNKHLNWYKNLEWVTRQENADHAS